MSDDTVAYQRPERPDWKHRIEHALDRMYDAYSALWDVMPAVAAFVVLLWLASWVPNHHQ